MENVARGNAENQLRNPSRFGVGEISFSAGIAWKCTNQCVHSLGSIQNVLIFQTILLFQTTLNKSFERVLSIFYRSYLLG